MYKPIANALKAPKKSLRETELKQEVKRIKAARRRRDKSGRFHTEPKKGKS
jgi:hypothetical protein